MNVSASLASPSSTVRVVIVASFSIASPPIDCARRSGGHLASGSPSNSFVKLPARGYADVSRSGAGRWTICAPAGLTSFLTAAVAMVAEICLITGGVMNRIPFVGCCCY